MVDAKSRPAALTCASVCLCVASALLFVAVVARTAEIDGLFVVPRAGADGHEVLQGAYPTPAQL